MVSIIDQAQENLKKRSRKDKDSICQNTSATTAKDELKPRKTAKLCTI